MPQLASKGYQYLLKNGVQLEHFNGSAYDPVKVTALIQELIDPTPALSLVQETPAAADLFAGRYLSGYQQSAVARALIKVGKMGLDNTKHLLRDALARQAAALDTIRAAARAWDALLEDEVNDALRVCGLSLSGAPLATPTPVATAETGGPKMLHLVGLDGDVVEAVRQNAETHEGVYLSSKSAKRLLRLIDEAYQIGATPTNHAS